MDWLLANKEWFFSGFGVFLLGGLLNFFLKRDNGKSSLDRNNIVINNQNHLTGPVDSPPILLDRQMELPERTLESYKNQIRILFIDDDARFKVAKILTKSGWVHTKLIKDAATLDDRDIMDADILFIDVQGVGVELGFSDEGLGLALAIKQKYPKKKVVIYSAETKGDRFHAALRSADSFLSKNADPYEFQKIVEDFTIGSHDLKI